MNKKYAVAVLAIILILVGLTSAFFGVLGGGNKVIFSGIETSTGEYKLSYIFEGDHINFSFKSSDEFTVETNPSSLDMPWVQVTILDKISQQEYLIVAMLERDKVAGREHCFYDFCKVTPLESVNTKNVVWNYLGYITPGYADMPKENVKKQYTFSTVADNYNLYLISPYDLRTPSYESLKKLFDSIVLTVN